MIKMAKSVRAKEVISTKPVVTLISKNPHLI